MPAADPFDLERFVQAQAPVIDTVRAELRAGDKRTHWMWFVFPQLRALGRSATAVHYGLRSVEEAAAYYAHPVLGPRLRDCCELLLQVEDRSIDRILGSPDNLKLRSCMTLFQLAAPHEALFGQVLAQYYGGRPDARTQEICASGGR